MNHRRVAPTTPRRGALALLIGVVGALGVAGVAWAFWSAPGVGPGRVTTGTLVGPATTTASAPLNSSTVTVSWSAAKLASGQSATGYYLVRVRDSDSTSFAACGTSATTKITTLTCSDTGVTDGDYHYVVTGTFGSWTATGAASASVHVVNNNALPSVTVTSISPTPNGNGWNNTSPVTVNLTATAGLGVRSITYSVDAGANVVVTASTAAVPVSGDGTHTVSYFATDNLGQVSQTQSVNVRIDRVAPAAPSTPTLTAASDSGSSTTDGITKVVTPTFTGTAETGATVTLYDGSTAIGSAAAAGSTYAITSTTLTNGPHTITAVATDVASNVSPASSSSAITIDTTVPATPPAPTLSAASDSGISSSDRITNVRTPVFTGTAEAGSTVTLYNSAAAVGTAVASTGGTWSVTSASLTTGTRSMTVKATDPAGNVSSASAITTVTIDYTAPSKPGTATLTATTDSGRLATDKITNVTAPTITATTTAATTVTVFDGSTTLGTVYAAASPYSFAAPTLAEGTHAITAKAADAAGNVSAASTSSTVTIDTVAPVAPATPDLVSTSDTGRSSTDDITNKVAPAFTGTTELKALVTLSEDGAVLGTVTLTSTTSGSYTVTSSALDDDMHTVTATATDVAGNVGPASGSTTITVDTVAPDAPPVPNLTVASDTGVSASDGITKDTTPTFTGTVEPAAIAALYDGSTATGSAVTTAGSGAYTATTSTLTNGIHNISVRATDVAGNVSVTSATTQVVIDTVAPSVTVDQASGQTDPTSGSVIHFTVMFSETVTDFATADVTLSSTAGTVAATSTGSGAQYDVAVTGMSKAGTVTASMLAGKATDVAGNTNVASTSTDNSVTYSP